MVKLHHADHLILVDNGKSCVGQWQPYMTNHQIVSFVKKTKANKHAKAAQFALFLHLFCFFYFFLLFSWYHFLLAARGEFDFNTPVN